MFNQDIINFLQQLEDQGCTPYIVGGAVRDALLGDFNPKDLDIEVYTVSPEKLLLIASSFGKASLVGQSFGVIKLQHPTLGEIDISLPRRDSKVSAGYKGFTVEVDPFMSVQEASSRRDFTINSMMWNPTKGLVDPHGGEQDLKDRILRHTSSAFAEDPLRVLRGVQFVGRFNLTAAPETVELCKQLKGEFSSLAVERIWIEWEKWATKSTTPSRGLMALQETTWIDLYPELAAIQGVPQNPQWHPEGSVDVHTWYVCDAAANIAVSEGLSKEDRTVLMFAALCHDLAKATTTEWKDGKWTSYGHEKAGEEPTISFLQSIGAPNWVVERVVPLVKEHLAYAGKDEPTAKMVRRLAERLGDKVSIKMLSLLVWADQSGRPPLPQVMPERMAKIVEMAEVEHVIHGKPKPILLGRHLIQLGLKPNKKFGVILAKAMEAQLEGEFGNEEEGIEWLQSNVIVQS